MRSWLSRVSLAAILSLVSTGCIVVHTDEHPQRNDQSETEVAQPQAQPEINDHYEAPEPPSIHAVTEIDDGSFAVLITNPGAVAFKRLRYDLIVTGSKPNGKRPYSHSTSIETAVTLSARSTTTVVVNEPRSVVNRYGSEVYMVDPDSFTLE